MAHYIISISAITIIALLIRALRKKKEITYGFFTSVETAEACRKIFGKNFKAYVDESNPMELLERAFGDEYN